MQRLRLVESAKLAGRDPRAYLHLVVVRALRGLPPLLPPEVTALHLVEAHGWSEARATTAVSA